MYNLNKWIGEGRVVQDPVYTISSSNERHNRLFFTLAINHTRGESVDYVPVVCWGKLADAGSTYITKGKELYVEASCDCKMKDNKPVFAMNASVVRYGRDSQKVQNERKAAKASSREATDALADQLLANRQPVDEHEKLVALLLKKDKTLSQEEAQEIVNNHFKQNTDEAAAEEESQETERPF